MLTYLAQFEQLYLACVAHETADVCDCGCPSWAHYDLQSGMTRRTCAGCVPCYELRGRAKHHLLPFDSARTYARRSAEKP